MSQSIEQKLNGVVESVLALNKMILGNNKDQSLVFELRNEIFNVCTHLRPKIAVALAYLLLGQEDVKDAMTKFSETCTLNAETMGTFEKKAIDVAQIRNSARMFKLVLVELAAMDSLENKDRLTALHTGVGKLRETTLTTVG